MSVDVNALPDLAHLEIGDPNPFVLFNEWFADAKNYLPYELLNAMNIATVSKNGIVSNRIVLCQDIQSDCIVFNTDNGGRKSGDIDDHPQVSVTFYWCYTKDGRATQRQVRFEGNAIKMDRAYAEKQFSLAPIFSKVRNMYCNQGKEVEWNDLKRRHNEAILKVKTTKDIKLDDNPNLVYIKIVPERMEFYYSFADAVADRVAFTKTGNTWKNVHLEP